MTRVSTLLALTTALAASAAPAPRIEPAAPPLTPDNVAKLQPVGEIPIDGWELVWGPKGGELSILQWLGPVDVLDAKTFKPLRKLAGDRQLAHVAFARGGDLVAWSDNATKQVEITELSTGKTRKIEVGGTQADVRFSPDGKFLATGVYGKQATLWNVDTSEKVRTFDTDTDGGLRVVFTADGKTLALSNRNSTTSIYEVATGKLLHVLPAGMTQEVRFNPAGTALAVGYVDGTVRLWDVATGKLLHERASGAKEVYSVDWSPKGDLLATSGLEGKIMVWDPKELKPLKELDAPEWVIRVRFSPDGSRLFTAGGTTLRSLDRKVTIWGTKDRPGN
jgi:WD40 repeat protein